MNAARELLKDRTFARLAGFFLFVILFLTSCGPVKVTPWIEPTRLVPSPATSGTATASSTPAAKATPAATPAAVCEAKEGSLETGVISTALLDKPMRYTVFLPPCYTSDEQRRYPALYLLHGQGFAEDQWIRIGAAATASQLVTAGEIPPFIIVFPYDFSYKQPTEYKFEEVFVEQLIPLIDSSYRTRTDASQRAIGGLSRGGAWALHIGARHPELFGAIGGHSPSIFFVDKNALPRYLLAIPPAQIPRIWLDAGDRDSDYAIIQAFEDFLSKNNITHVWHGYVGWHDEKYWSAHVDEYLAWYAQGWK
ncbi:MAG TPA: alpha/beta hydrolase-fold protein [Anaerolineales bacterium]|jgi:enterochelin esterase-like enzyme